MAFTADIKPRLLTEVVNVFNDRGNTDARYSIEAATAPVLLSRQTARSTQRMRDGECIGTTVWFFDSGADSGGYEGTTFDAALDCTAGTCTEGGTESQDYDHNIHYHDCKTVDTFRCSSQLQYEQESGRQLYHLMYGRRLSLNKFIINTIAASAQQNQTPTAQMPSYINEQTAPSNILEIASANMTQANGFETMVEMNNISMQNGLFNPIVLNGRNFSVNQQLAQYNRLNDNQRSEGAYFDPTGIAGNFYWDLHPTHGVDTITGALSSLVVNPNSYIFWNYTLFPETPVMVDGSTNRWIFSMPDPFITYNDGGTTRRLMYDVEKFSTCVGYAANGMPNFRDTYRVHLRGGFAFAPSGYDAAGTTQVYTGAMHYAVV